MTQPDLFAPPSTFTAHNDFGAYDVWGIPDAISLIDGEVAEGLTRGKPLQILRIGPLFDRFSGDLVVEVTDDMVRELVETFSDHIPIDWNHGSAVCENA